MKESDRIILTKVAPYIEAVAIDILGDYNPLLTWAQMGCDDLDIVEIVMKLEVVANVSIDDELATLYFDMGQTPQIFRKYLREEAIKKVLE